MPLHLDTLIRPLRPAVHWENGGPVDVDALRGRPVLIHFWALSCAACKEQMAQVNHWTHAWGDRLAVVGIHTPLSVEDMDVERVIDTVRALELSHPVGLDGEDGALADAYQVHITPAYFLFDANGRLRHYHAGLEATDPVGRAIERLLRNPLHEAQAHPHH